MSDIGIAIDELNACLGTGASVRHGAALPARVLTNVQWRADACDGGSILVFQRFDDGRDDAEICRRYLTGCPAPVLVVNRWFQGLEQLTDTRIHVAEPDQWGAILERLCDLFFPVQWGGLRLAGVTGTNGKTTTVKFLEAMLLACGHQVLSIGTLGLFLNGVRIVETGFTSPPYVELRRILHRYQDQVDFVLMEASSHALDQGRVHGLRFDTAAWTNFSRDHLDYHGTEAAYFAAKSRLLGMVADGGRLYTTDPVLYEQLGAGSAAASPVELLAVPEPDAAIIAEKPFLALDYNWHNYALALAMAGDLSARIGAGDAPWRALRPVEGRFDCRVHGRFTLVIDFAHTPDALENLLGAMRRSFPSARLATLFGCGGDRDKTKRPLMGAVAARLSDALILTSDNPRFESPEAIIADILPGVSGRAHEVVVDRRSAIERLFAMLVARPVSEQWVALIAGKGHERYIDRNGIKEPYSDAEEVEKQVRRWQLA